MLKELFKPDPSASIEVHTIGEGEHRVVTVDGFYQHPEQVVELAADLYYAHGKVNGNYPGGRAVISLDTGPVIKVLGHLWGRPLRPYAQDFQPVMFSTLRGGIELNIAQRSPHVDPGITAMVYLNAPGDCLGGTGIYRHKPTGVELVPPQLTEEMLALATPLGYGAGFFKTPADYTTFQDSIIFNPLFAAPPNEYINDGNDYWELLHLVEMKFNRLVIFDGRMPHSQYIKPGQFTDTIRLNQIAYLDEA